MRRCVVVALLLTAAVLVLPATASAVTLPADGSTTAAIPVALSTTDVGPTMYVSFRIDGAQVANVRPAIQYGLTEEGDRYVKGYKAVANVAIADGPHVYEIWQSGALKFHGKFVVDADPILVDYWFDGVGDTGGALYFKLIDNDAIITANAYEADKTGTGGALPEVSRTTAAGITTVVRKLAHSHSYCDMLQMLYAGEVHGCSLKITDGYSYDAQTLEGVYYPKDNMDISWNRYSAVEVCCSHWGDNDPETVMEHEESCWHAPIEWDYGIYGP